MTCQTVTADTDITLQLRSADLFANVHNGCSRRLPGVQGNNHHPGNTAVLFVNGFSSHAFNSVIFPGGVFNTNLNTSGPEVNILVGD
ncbi:hypothetical protein SCLCIDRAFT_1132046 [Scleroderma citrinum Foug A]|uniref:Uncharacterized protein n=1 Tax=Scleroderma citrinum Foug A TaxID=1036808 RepID=A0A0C2ZYK1_9AGAM|nr:hypothetical protein SCLCIDRAFT_1132046 [Scleroderma citrinum Foug A]